MFLSRALSQASAIASSSRDPAVCDQMKGSLIKKQVKNNLEQLMVLLRNCPSLMQDDQLMR